VGGRLFFADMAWRGELRGVPWLVLVEFDGDVKYRGADGAQELIHEKVREDAIRGRYGARFVRVTTAMTRRPDELMTTLLAAFSSRPRLTPRPHLALPRPTHPRPST